MDTQYAVYLGHEQQNGFTGFLAEKNFFCVVEIFDGYTQDQGELLMAALSEVQQSTFDNLVAFESAITGILKRLNVPLDTSIAAGYMRGDIFYLKTGGTGQIYLHRGKATEKIIFGDNIASGKCVEHDLFIFTTSFFTESLKGIHTLKSLLHTKNSLEDYPEHIKHTLDKQDDTGAVALFVGAVKASQIYATPAAYDRQGIDKKMAIIEWFKKQKKIVLVGILIVCIASFAWNMRGKFASQTVSPFSAKMQELNTLLEKTNSEKEDMFGAMVTLENAQNVMALLNHMSESKDHQKEMDTLQKRIRNLKDEVLKREYPTAAEFFNLNVEEKNAQATVCSLVGDELLLLNPSGVIYRLSLDKKSLTKQKLSKSVPMGTLVGGYDANIYLYEPHLGIIRVDSEGKQKTVVAQDSAWGAIGGIQLYNGNIYLLDREVGGVIKYAGIPDGFGDKVAYFQGSHDSTDQTSTLAIDSSLYVSTATTVAKYTAGLKDEFQFKLPEADSAITKVIAHKDEAQIYIWDKKKGALLTYTKDGGYVKQVVVSDLKKATDVEIYKSQAFLLMGSQIIRIGL